MYARMHMCADQNVCNVVKNVMHVFKGIVPRTLNHAAPIDTDIMMLYWYNKYHMRMAIQFLLII